MAKNLPSGAAAEIVRLHGEIHAAARTSLDKAIRIGELLTQEKAKVGYGEWSAWLEINEVPFTKRTAQNYTRIYEQRERLRNETVSDLTSAYQILAESGRQVREEPKPAPPPVSGGDEDARSDILPTSRDEAPVIPSNPASPAASPDLPPPEPWSLARTVERFIVYSQALLLPVPADSIEQLKAQLLQVAWKYWAPAADAPAPEPWGDRKVIPPLPEWVTAYSAKIGYAMNGEAWCDSYAQKGWIVGKVKMKDWQSAVRNWKTSGWGLGTITLSARKAERVTDNSVI